MLVFEHCYTFITRSLFIETSIHVLFLVWKKYSRPRDRHDTQQRGCLVVCHFVKLLWLVCTVQESRLRFFIKTRSRAITHGQATVSIVWLFNFFYNIQFYSQHHVGGCSSRGCKHVVQEASETTWVGKAKEIKMALFLIGVMKWGSQVDNEERNRKLVENAWGKHLHSPEAKRRLRDEQWYETQILYTALFLKKWKWCKMHHVDMTSLFCISSE